MASASSTASPAFRTPPDVPPSTTFADSSSEGLWSIFQDEIEARQRVAAVYAKGLSGVVRVPRVIDGATSVWAQYTVVLERGDRNAVAAKLKAQGIPTAIYYP